MTEREQELETQLEAEKKGFDYYAAESNKTISMLIKERQYLISITRLQLETKILYLLLGSIGMLFIHYVIKH